MDYEKLFDKFDTELLEAIKKSYEQKCLVKNFHLVKVKLPTNVYEEIKAKYEEVVSPSFADPKYIFSIPVEKDENISRIQYVIEGELEFLE